MIFKKISCIICLLLFVFLLACTNDSQIEKTSLLTRWAGDVDLQHPWPEYPRPQFKREEWRSLNGIWQFSVLDPDGNTVDEGDILVPYPMESYLSGVQKILKPDQSLKYSTSFNIPAPWKKEEVILHFGAVDWESELYVNSKMVGDHKGGYDPFSFNITNFLKEGENKLELIVKDPTDSSWQPRGKQVLEPEKIFYTPVSGIWQTVWMEAVPKIRFTSFKIVPDIDNQTATLLINADGNTEGTELRITTKNSKQEMYTFLVPFETSVVLPITDIELWSPETPNLYDLQVELLKDRAVIDKVDSYFGMRKIHIEKTADGQERIFLNNKPYFQNGVLDQGYWPDGLYTPPTDKAMKNEIEMVKDLGFNMLRKHVKVESSRFYYWCDKLGVLVWQDMPSGDRATGQNELEIERSPESEKQFRKELGSMIGSFYNHPSIVMWIPFNEGWGQYKTGETVDFVSKLDSTRLINNASGWVDHGIGDVLDIHHYPEPVLEDAGENRVFVLGEFGGIGLAIEDHIWLKEGNWGYENLPNKEEFIRRYENYYDTVWSFEKKGLGAAVYTQLTDVETEANGLLTYDRAVLKADKKILYKINTNNFLRAPGFLPDEKLLNKGDSIKIMSSSEGDIYYTIDGTKPDRNSLKYNGAVVFNDDIKLSAIVYAENDSSRISVREFSKTELKRPEYRTAFNPKYTGGSSFALVDGVQGSTDIKDGTWQGFYGNDLDVIIDLGEEQRPEGMEIGFLEDIRSWVFLPVQVKVSGSADGKNFKTENNSTLEIPSESRDAYLYKHSIKLKGDEPIRYLRIYAANLGECPEWHPGKGNPSWIFVDEIEVK
ncbi:hypothetical protein GWK08_03355 [Leptobacterium flavescens]|uniref:Beta-galactosidase n=1 Tax=Leptobacterium flavescens TaxID=472055 RepID=A0A6P0UGT8_9FLAO|nr:sugar-binding domain-containing protein [Leptobacterium flavescens]NER12465.1 hypothetical protein [Leptobacterium flavescens]